MAAQTATSRMQLRSSPTAKDLREFYRGSQGPESARHFEWFANTILEHWTSENSKEIVAAGIVGFSLEALKRFKQDPGATEKALELLERAVSAPTAKLASEQLVGSNAQNLLISAAEAHASCPGVVISLMNVIANFSLDAHGAVAFLTATSGSEELCQIASKAIKGFGWGTQGTRVIVVRHLPSTYLRLSACLP